MNRCRIVPSRRFKRDLRRVQRKGRRMDEVAGAIDILATGGFLGSRYRDRPLGGRYAGYRECRVAPGCLMVYRQGGDRLVLYRLRTPVLEGGYAMFLLTEVCYRLFRNPSRTALLLGVAALLMGSIAFYLGNIQANRAALDSLVQNVPVTVQVVNRNGSSSEGLRISMAHYTALAGAPVHQVQCTTTFAGAYSQGARFLAREGRFLGGDALLKGGNCLEALAIEEGDVQFLRGWGPGMFGGREAVCLANASFAQKAGIRLGDEISLPLFTMRYGTNGTRYPPLGEQVLKVVGIYQPRAVAASQAAELYGPIGWMQDLAQQADEVFSLESLCARLDDPMELNRFKASLGEMGFWEISETAQDRITGDAIAMDDEAFIKTAGELLQNLAVFNGFLPPFFALVVGMVTLVTFLVLRGSRREMAIASSLGRQKLLNGASHFLGAFLAELAGCGVALALAGLAAGAPLALAWGAAGVYMACACVGTALALVFLLRFDTLALLTKVD